MRRVLLSLTCAAALVACDSDSTPGNPTDTNPADVTDTNQPDTDTTQPDTDATQPDTDATQPDTTDTNQPDTTPTPTRKCTDAELDTFNTCADACPAGANQQTCINACFDGFSNECYDAFASFQDCMQTKGCFNDDGSADVECAAEFCADEVDAVFGTPEPTDCNPVTQAGCETGNICTVGDQAGNLYCVAPGDIPAFGDCAADPSGCSTGLCLGTATEAICMPFCNTSADCPDGRLCNVGLQGTDFVFCGDAPVSCDVLAQDCPNNQGCYIASQAGDTQCASHNGKATGAACQYLNDCAPGNLCLGSGTGTCTKLCDTAATPGTCAAGQTCQSLGLPGTVGACTAAP